MLRSVFYQGSDFYFSKIFSIKSFLDFTKHFIKHFGFLFFLVFTILIFFSLTFTNVSAQSSGQSQISTETASIVDTNESAIGLKIESLYFDSAKGELVLETEIENRTNSYIDSLGYTAEFFEGEELLYEGDIFSDLEYSFAKTGKVEILSPSSVRKDVLRIGIPETVSEGDYFAKLLVSNKTGTKFGLTYTDYSFELFGSDSLSVAESFGFYDQLIHSAEISSNDYEYVLTLSDDYVYDEKDRIEVSVYKVGFGERQVGGVIKGEISKIGLYDQNSNSILFNLRKSNVDGPGIYEIEARIFRDDLLILDPTKTSFSVGETFSYLHDIEIEKINYIANEYIEGSVDIVNVGMELVSLELSITGQEGDFVLEKDIFMDPNVLAKTFSLNEFVLPTDTQISKILFTLKDSKGNILDSYSMTLPDPTGSTGGQVVANFVFNDFVQYTIYLVVAIFIGVTIWFVLRKKKDAVSYVLILFTFIVSVFLSFDTMASGASGVFQTPNLFIDSNITKGDHDLCPRREQVAIIGSSRCAIDGKPLSGEIVLQKREVESVNWEDLKNYYYTPTSSGSKIFGPYIYTFDLYQPRVEVGIRGQFQSNDSSSLCLDEFVQTSPSKLTCDVDLCTNIDGEQLVVPEAGDWFDVDGKPERVTDLGMVQFDTQCFSLCSSDVACESGSECVVNPENAIRYCRPSLTNTCEVDDNLNFTNPRKIFTRGEQLYFKVNTGGGDDEYSYEWGSVDDILESNIATKSYTENGDYSLKVGVSSGDLETDVFCPISIRDCNRDADCELGMQCSLNGYCVKEPIVASCAVYSDSSLKKQIYNTNLGEQVYWHVTPEKGTAPFNFRWDGSVQGTAETISASYSTFGKKRSVVNLKDSSTPSQEVSVQCEVFVKECNIGDNSVCRSGYVCRSDFLCGPPLPSIATFKVTDSDFTSLNGSCSTEIKAFNSTKCSIINSDTSSKISLSAASNGIIDEEFEISAGNYILECINNNEDIVSSDPLVCRNN